MEKKKQMINLEPIKIKKKKWVKLAYIEASTKYLSPVRLGTDRMSELHITPKSPSLLKKDFS